MKIAFLMVAIVVQLKSIGKLQLDFLSLKLKLIFSYSIRCKECECKQEGLKHVTYKDVGCIELKLHDGFCDDDQNHYTCNYDGGDCCMHTQAYANWYATPERVAYFINDFRCTECICKRPAVSFKIDTLDIIQTFFTF